MYLLKVMGPSKTLSFTLNQKDLFCFFDFWVLSGKSIFTQSFSILGKIGFVNGLMSMILDKVVQFLFCGSRSLERAILKTMRLSVEGKGRKRIVQLL